MDWQQVDFETVQQAMPSELFAAYASWIEAHPDKKQRLGEIIVHVRTEFRDSIASHPANVLDPREDYLPVSSLRHLESLVWYSLCMEMGYRLSSAAQTAATAANLYLRQIAYGRYKFESEDGSGELVPTGTVPARKEYGTRTLAAVALLLFVLFAPFARAEWGRDPWSVSITNVVADYTPQNYPITTSTLYSHLQGIDTMLGMLSDTNGLYGRLVGLPQLVYDTLDTIQEHSLYGEYRPEADAWLCLSQTNAIFQGQVMASQLRTRKDEISGTSGDLIVGGGIELGGEYRTNWPSGGGGGEGRDYLPVTWQQSPDDGISAGSAVVFSNVVFMGTFRVWGSQARFDGPIYVEDADWNHLPMIDTHFLKLGGVARTNWPSGLFTARVSSTDTSVVADDYLVWLDTSALGSEDEIVLDLPDMAAEAQTIVVRRLGNDGYATVRRVTATATNTFSLGADGSAIAIDWLGARTNWYWRQAY